MNVVGYSKKRNNFDEKEFRCVKSTLYNPLRQQLPNYGSLKTNLEQSSPDFMILPAIKQMDVIPKIATKFGIFSQGSVLAVQQQLDSEYIINIYDGVGFPKVPPTTNKRMGNNFLAFVPTIKQSGILDDISVTSKRAHMYEEKTHNQSKSPLWYKLRKYRVTASTIGEISKRRGNFETLVSRLKSKRFICTAAMQRGIDEEPNAAIQYGNKNNNNINIYPSGIILSPECPWIAASPDRKVYNPMRQPPFGLLEIKCPMSKTVDQILYLKEVNGEKHLKRNHNYYYQIQTQLAVSGMDWCDFYIYLKDEAGVVEDFVETIYYDQLFWSQTKEKIDAFYFNYYI